MSTKTAPSRVQHSSGAKAKPRRRRRAKIEYTDKTFVDSKGNLVRVRKGSFLDLAWDLVGSVQSGKGDLSTNPVHMEGYGRD